MITFSIVMPTYNVASFLPQALECILAQTCGAFELLLVDDCSTDASGAIAEEYVKKFRQAGRSMQVIRQPENQGVAAARNAGLARTSGDYVIFLDPDDFYEKKLLETVAQAVAAEQPDIVLYGYSEDYYREDATLDYSKSFTTKAQCLGREQIPDAVVELERDTMYGYAWNKAYRREFLQRHGVVFTQITHIEDILFNIAAFEHAQKVVFLEEVLYHYRNQGQMRLTGQYLKDYFPLQKQRIREFLDQQERWGNCDDRVLEAIAPFYFRSFQSAIVRELEHGTPKAEIMAMAERELSEPLYLLLREHLGGGRAVKLLYAPLAKGNTGAGIRRAAWMCRIKKYAPGLFARLKQQR